MMQAVLLAAGFGTRLGDLTRDTPKCLIDVGGRPMLEHWLAKLVDVGVEHVFVNTHYLADHVNAYLQSSSYSDIVEPVYEPTLLGTAGTIRAFRNRLTAEEVLVAHADNYFTDTLHGLVATHRARPAETVVTMGLFESATPQSCGIVELDSRNMVVGFEEKPDNPKSSLANAAVYVFSQAGLDEVGNATDLSTEVLPRLVGRMMGHRFIGEYFDVGTPQSLDDARRVATTHG
jgi:mannose-1-phosphate guanylyltransferase